MRSFAAIATALFVLSILSMWPLHHLGGEGAEQLIPSILALGLALISPALAFSRGFPRFFPPLMVSLYCLFLAVLLSRTSIWVSYVIFDYGHSSDQDMAELLSTWLPIFAGVCGLALGLAVYGVRWLIKRRQVR